MTKYVGVNTTSLLGIAFVVLKLTKCIDWSWLWVLSPFWIPWLFLILTAFVYGFIKALK